MEWYLCLVIAMLHSELGEKALAFIWVGISCIYIYKGKKRKKH